MTATGGPPPATSTEMWLAAVWEQVVGLRADLAAQRAPIVPEPADGQVELREPDELGTRRTRHRPPRG